MSLSFVTNWWGKKQAMCQIRTRRRLATTTTPRQRQWYHVVVALSGGVDSSVAAALLKQQVERNGNNHNLQSDNHHHHDNTRPTSLSAIHMSNWNSHHTHDDDSLQRTCPTLEQDWQDASAVARHLQLTLQRQYLEAEYWTSVFDPYVTRIIQDGQIGNPDVPCNQYIKFGTLLQRYCLQAHGPTCRLATGHYARLWHRSTRSSTSPEDDMPECVAVAYQVDTTGTADWIASWGCSTTASSGKQLPSILLAAADRTKDQSYFLAACSGDALRNVLFPLGDLYKKSSSLLSNNGSREEDAHHVPHQAKTVRQLAQEWNLPTAQKRESMGICFVGTRPHGFQTFLQQYVPPPATRVDLVDIETGRIVGTTNHHAALFAIGQGAKVSGMPQKYYVVGNSIATDTTTTTKKTAYERAFGNGHYKRPQPDHAVVWVCAGTHHPALYADVLFVEQVHWMAANECPWPLRHHGVWRTQCRIRHLQPLMDCTVRVMQNDNNNKELLEVHFDKPVRGIAPGQQIVFYGLDGLVCFGGGPIARRGPTFWEDNRQLPKDLNPSGLNDRSLGENQGTL